MRNWIIIIAIAGAGIAIGVWDRWEFSDIRWSPLYGRQLPQPHSTTKFAFGGDAGDFEIIVKTPMLGSNMPEAIGPNEQPSMSCNLEFRVSAGDRLVTTGKVASLHWSGIVGSSHMNCFIGGVIKLPNLDKYTIDVSNIGEEFKTPDANFSLVRKENAENSAVLSGVSMVVSLVLIGMSIFMTVSFCVRYWLTRRG